VRDGVTKKSIEMRRQGFFGAAMLPMSELEYTGIVEKLTELDKRFTVRG
jgi:fructose 1,6-bisphosphate aldolase/phosphatase